MSGLPTGTVTFLFADVEASTRMARVSGEHYVEDLAQQRGRLHEAFAACGGMELPSDGDGFFVVFGSARDAVSAARAAQAAAAEGWIRFRMGLHTGEAQPTADGYIGLDVHRAARIAAVGHGGQVLLSRSTRELVDADVRE